ncbi:efflux RND transporter permease subunit [Pseudomaricurvus alcaniphilus]|uniref:efflux RND transporter permease subunit n=1 Tax=Pseudomaricurvus alcaniphilus TaxID=1166482 RepID=UPI001409A3CB|nr:efflux RND transporter permease subunit [Pseudomaricurvus alcaniphilus]NHN36334.1 efflux RND transporter permease subunit [Pseudomaricurvus alcaniphilus]
MFEHIVKRGILMTVITLIVSVLGILAAARIPVQMIPDLDVRTISIRTNWPGATPQDVEKEILIEQEEYLRNLPNLARIIATANSGQAEIELEFPFGTDITEMLIRVNNALSQVPSYPESVDEPRIYANSFSGNSFMFFSITPLPGNPRQLDMDLMQDFVEDNVKPRMARVTGVSEVNISGGAERQLQILIDPARLAQRQLSLADVRNAIRTRNRDRSGGEIDSGKRQYLLRTIGRFQDLEELQQLVLARRGDAIIRLQDVATVQLDHFEKRDNTSFNGERNIFVSIRREAGSNVIDIKRDMLVELAGINRDVLEPAGMSIQLMADDVRYVEDSVRNVWQNLAIGSLLAVAVMFLFLRSLRATAVGVMGVPICIIVAFLGLLLFGRTVNVISLAGIAFAIGMTLDNSIVVLESIELERRRGLDRMQAAISGVKKVWPAVFASTMTTVLVFLPVAFVEQEAGQLYSDVAIAISAAILASMLVAITVLPTAAARLRLEADPHAGGKLGDYLSAHHWGLRARHFTLNGVNWLLSTRRRRLGCIAITILLSAAIIIGLTPPAEYLPEGEEPKVFATMNAPPGYNLAAMQEIGADIQAYLLPFVSADPAVFHRGDAPVPAIRYFNMRVSSQSLRIIAEPVEAADIDELMDALTAKYQEYPGMRAFAARGSIITSNDGGTRSINLDISGPDLAAIYQVAQAAYLRAGEVFDNPRIQTNPSSLTLAQPMVEIHPDWQRAAELGLNSEELGFTVAALTDGSYVDEFFLADDKIDIYLYSNIGQNAELDTLAQLPIYTPSGAVLPLASLARIEEKVDTSSMRRVNGSRTVTLNIIPPRSVALETGVEIVRNDLVGHLRAQGAIPAGVNLNISGAADQLDATRAALTSNYLVALLIIYLLLVAIFNHWGYPLLIMTSIPLGIAGGIVGLWLLNFAGGLLPWLGLNAIVQPFDMISMLGFLILMGTVVNNPILIVHRAVDNIDKQGMEVQAAVQEAVEARLRPIAMSTITTLFGLAPLVLIPGAGTELYRGVGAIVMFGIIGAALVTLTLLPALTTTVLQYTRRRHPAVQEPAPSP